MISERQPARRVQRDAWTRLLYLQLGAFAFFLYAFSPAIGFLRDDLHISAGVAGLHSATYAVGVTFGGVTAPWYITRAGGSPRAIWLGLLGLCSAVGLFCGVALLPVTLFAAAVCGVFGSYLCITVPSALSHAHGPDVGAAAITEANAVAAMVGVAAPLAIGGAAAIGIGWRTAFLAVVPLSAALYLALGRIREPQLLGPGDIELITELVAESVEADRIGIPSQRTAPDQADKSQDSNWRTLPRRFWVNQIAGICVGAIEFSLTLWCANLLRDRAHMSHSAAATGVTAIVAGMAIGRVVGGRLALRVPMDRLLFAAFAGNALGFALFWLATSPVAMFAGLAVSGVGMSVQFPLVSARGINLSGGRPELAGAVNMFGGGIAIGSAPFALGVLSDRIGIHAAYLLVPGLITVAVVALAASRTPHRAPSPLPASESIAA